MKNGKRIMTVVYILFANPPVLIFRYHIKACQCPGKPSPLSYPPDDAQTSVLSLSAFSSPLPPPYRKRTAPLGWKTEPDSLKTKVQFPIRAQNI